MEKKSQYDAQQRTNPQAIAAYNYKDREIKILAIPPKATSKINNHAKTDAPEVSSKKESEVEQPHAASQNDENLESTQKVKMDGIDKTSNIAIASVKEIPNEYSELIENMKTELHKVRMKNAELRQQIRKSEIEKDQQSKKLTKLNQLIEKSEKGREAVYCSQG